MYQSFYGLINKPFQLNPDPKFYFNSKQHQRARAYLEYGILRSEGFIVVTGEVGAGKTTIVRGLLESLDHNKIVAANLVSTQLDAEDTLRLVGAAFGIKVHGLSKSEILMALEAFFISQFVQGKRCLLIVDEAQNLKLQSVEELRMLSNFQYDKHALLQTFLVGQPEFRQILQSAEMLQLRQRITAKCHLGPLDLEETREYINHRLHCAGAKEKPILESEIYEVIYLYTDGIPRRINNLMERVLLNGFLSEKINIDKDLVNEIIDEINAEAYLSDKSVKATILKEYINSDEKKIEIKIDEKFSENISQKLINMSVESLNARLTRMESSVLRQERVSLEILVAFQKLVENYK
jgi:putative secretion ATPase (PEP-CTERM system associated)